MPLPMGDWTFALKEIEAVETALREGHPPPGLPIPGSNKRRSAIRIAADRLGLDPQTLRQHVGSEDHPGRIWRRFELLVDWSQYQPIVVLNSHNLRIARDRLGRWTQAGLFLTNAKDRSWRTFHT
jgi:hypothetical protein